MKWLIPLLLLINLSLQGQITDYSYSGPPGDIKVWEINVLPLSVYQFDFSAQHVPDALVIYLISGDSIEVIIGNYIFTPQPQQHLYRGYTEFEYDEDGNFNHYQLPGKPLDYAFPWGEFGGCCRLIFYTPKDQCTLRFKLKGNNQAQTIYNLEVKQLNEGQPTEIDTSRTISCEQEYDYWQVHDCMKTLNIVEYHGFNNVLPTIIPPTCYDSNDGQVILQNVIYEGLRLDTTYHFEVSNAYCSKGYDIKIKQPRLNCNYYVPNIKRIDEGWTLYTKYTIELKELRIYDRWGSLIIKINNPLSNVELLLPELLPNNVYIYTFITLDGETISGDLTVVD